MAALELKIPPPLVFLGVAVLMWFVTVPGLDLSLPFRVPVAVAFAVLGAGIDVVAIRAFRAAGTTLDPLSPGRATSLVRGGIFAISRNPMYLGQAVVLLGWAVFLANAMAFVALPAFVFWLNRFQIGPEEKALTQRFGAEYTAYCAQVRRWL